MYGREHPADRQRPFPMHCPHENGVRRPVGVLTCAHFTETGLNAYAFLGVQYIISDKEDKFPWSNKSMERREQVGSQWPCRWFWRRDSEVFDRPEMKVWYRRKMACILVFK